MNFILINSESQKFSLSPSLVGISPGDRLKKFGRVPKIAQRIYIKLFLELISSYIVAPVISAN